MTTHETNLVKTVAPVALEPFPYGQQEIILTTGLPCSGKSTWAKNIVKTSKGRYVIVCRDDIRKMLFGVDELVRYWRGRVGDRENLVTKVQMSIADAALSEGKSVIVADTNLSDIAIHSWNEKAIARGIDFNRQHFSTGPAVCADRDSRRAEKVGEDVIFNMAKKFEQYCGSSPWDEPEYDRVYRRDEKILLPKAIIVDVDGTVARRVSRSPYDYSKVAEDLPNEDVIDVVTSYAGNQGANLIFVSGRKDECYSDTKEWLEHNVCDNFELFMRNEKDGRSDDIVKAEIFWSHIAEEYDVIGVFDDRDRVVNMWRQIGLRCYQVDHGRF